MVEEMDLHPESVSLEIRVFGEWEARVAGEPMSRLRSRTERHLLAWLVLHAGSEVSREALAGTLWPESAPDRGLFYLRRALMDLRQALGPEAARLTSPTPRTLRFDAASPSVFIDALAFDVAIARSTEQSLTYAIELYRGPLLRECSQVWALSEREARERAYVEALERLARLAVERQAPETAVRWLQQAIRTDPARETAQQALIQALAASGNAAGMVQAYRAFRLYLHNELNAAPAPETIELYQRLQARTRETTATRPVQPATRLAAPPTRHLPIPLSPLIGRESDIEDAHACLRSNRLVTLTGSGGVGKTRLSIAIAERSEDDFPDGVWFVDLAPHSPETNVADAIATTLCLREEHSETALHRLLGHLRDLALLIILDNCEHVLDSAARTADVLLAQCPSLKILTTSRQPLSLPGEISWRVPSLALPAPVRSPGSSRSGEALKERAEEILNSAAVRLLIDRARRASPGWLAATPDIEIIAAICRDLDGIPLAIELAAARVKSLSVEGILRRLDARLNLLTGGSRTLARHQTLRAALDWSHDLLNESEKALLSRLSVFSGGWTLEAAEAVCSGMPVEERHVLDLLTSLCDKSLVIAEEQGRAIRYRLLETVRQYGRDLMLETGEGETWRNRHLAHFLALVEEAEPHLSRAEQTHWLEQLEIEHENLRAALQWSADGAENRAGGLRMAGALWHFWEIRGHLSEGRTWLAGALSSGPVNAPDPARAKALHGAGCLAWRQGDQGSAWVLHEESLAIRRKLGDRPGIAGSLGGLGLIAAQRDDYASARAFYEECLEIRLETGDRTGIAWSLTSLGEIAAGQGDYASAQALFQQALEIHRELGSRTWEAINLVCLGGVAVKLGDYAAAQDLNEQSLAIQRELGNGLGTASSLFNLGEVAHRQGDYASARSLYEEALGINRELGNRNWEARNLGSLGLVAYDQGDYASAMTLHKESLEIQQELGDRSGIAASLEGLASVAVVLDAPCRGAALWGAAERLREEIGSPLPPDDRARRERDVSAARAALRDDAAFSASWKKGCEMSPEEAVEYALKT